MLFLLTFAEIFIYRWQYFLRPSFSHYLALILVGLLYRNRWLQIFVFYLARLIKHFNAEFGIHMLDDSIDSLDNLVDTLQPITHQLLIGSQFYTFASHL